MAFSCHVFLNSINPKQLSLPIFIFSFGGLLWVSIVVKFTWHKIHHSNHLTMKCMGLLNLVSFSDHGLWVHLCYSSNQYFIAFYCQIIFHYIYTINSLSIHELKDIWVVSTFWLLWIVRLCTFMYKYLFDYLLSILLGIYLRMEMLSHITHLYLSFAEWPNCFPQ